MILCSPECDEICDFCAYQMQCGPYSGMGFCISKGKYVDWCSSCNDDFHCFRAIVEPHVPTLVEFIYLSAKIAFTTDEVYDTWAAMPLGERIAAFRNLAAYTFKGRRRGKNAK